MVLDDATFSGLIIITHACRKQLYSFCNFSGKNNL